jgi:hypothetical protein
MTRAARLNPNDPPWGYSFAWRCGVNGDHNCSGCGCGCHQLDPWPWPTGDAADLNQA